MYEIRKNVRIIDRHGVPTFTREIVDCNLLEVEAGTNGYQGGDGGHGCRTYIRIQDLGSTSIRVNPIVGSYGDKGVEIILAGDAELSTMIQALEFITQALKDGSKERVID